MLKHSALHVSKLRQNMTPAENKLWYHLRAKRFKGFKFRRQHRIHPFVVDFVCLNKKLIIELDGGHHSEQAMYDDNRSLYLQDKGFCILRFWNSDIYQKTESVLESILQTLKKLKWS